MKCFFVLELIWELIWDMIRQIMYKNMMRRSAIDQVCHMRDYETWFFLSRSFFCWCASITAMLLLTWSVASTARSVRCSSHSRC